jgi:hypothetical protein
MTEAVIVTNEELAILCDIVASSTSKPARSVAKASFQGGSVRTIALAASTIGLLFPGGKFARHSDSDGDRPRSLKKRPIGHSISEHFKDVEPAIKHRSEQQYSDDRAKDSLLTLAPLPRQSRRLPIIRYRHPTA